MTSKVSEWEHVFCPEASWTSSTLTSSHCHRHHHHQQHCHRYPRHCHRHHHHTHHQCHCFSTQVLKKMGGCVNLVSQDSGCRTTWLSIKFVMGHTAALNYKDIIVIKKQSNRSFGLILENVKSVTISIVKHFILT